MALRMDPASLSDGMPAYAVGGGYLLPLGELCQNLDLAVQVDPDRGTAEGFIVDPARTFRLDARAGTFTLAGVTRPLDRGQAYLGDGDLYLDTRTLAPVPARGPAGGPPGRAGPRCGHGSSCPSRPGGSGRPPAAGWGPTAEEPLALPPIPDPYRMLEIPGRRSLSGPGRALAPGGRPEPVGTGAPPWSPETSSACLEAPSPRSRTRAG